MGPLQGGETFQPLLCAPPPQVIPLKDWPVCLQVSLQTQGAHSENTRGN